MNPYPASLDASRREIRRLTLQPESAGLPIVCTCETVSLLDDPDYEALSYVWGDSDPHETIIFIGSPFSVTANLASALRHLRLVDQPRRLWIDALCINQGDPDERSQQVLLMGEIYAKAQPVLVWLGEADAQSSACFEAILHFPSHDEIPSVKKNELFSFYFELVQRKWFTRVWTIQELVLARRDPLVGCGKHWILWDTLWNVWQQLATAAFTDMNMVAARQPSRNELLDANELVIRTTCIRLDLLHDLRTTVTTRHGETLRDLLLQTITADATEPRDRIYSLLGMMHEEDREQITVDYRRPLGMVFAEAVSHLCRKNQGTFFLSGVVLMGDSGPPSCPSWVPRFGDKLLLKPTSYHPPGVGVSGAGAECVNGTIDPGLCEFRVRGMYVDTVSDRIEFIGSDCLDHLPEIEQLAATARERAVSHSHQRPYLQEFKTKEPLWRTLIANKAYSAAERQIAPVAYEKLYFSLLAAAKNRNSQGRNGGKTDKQHNDYSRKLLNQLQSSCFFITETGFCGIGSLAIANGDHLAIWFGAPVPFVIRPCNLSAHGTEKPTYTVHGVAYVAGIMDGEMVDEVYCEDLEDDVTYVVV